MLKTKEGSLDETPFALLLHAIEVSGRSCGLEVRLRNLEKQFAFEDGALVGCESNLLHETLGASLVAKGKLTEAQHHQLFSESAAEEKSFSALLVERKILSAFELFKHLQANLAQRVIDVFRWSQARWKLIDSFEVETPIRINTTRLIYTAVSQMPEDLVNRHFSLQPSAQLAINPQGPSATESLKLAPKDLRLWNLLKTRPTLATLTAAPGFSPDEVRRRLFTWSMLEMIGLAEEVGPAPAPSPPTPRPVASEVEVPPIAGLPFLDDDPAAMNVLASEYLTVRGKDAFELLGVPVAFDTAVIQKAFLAKSSAIGPVRFRSSESRAKAESLLVAYAKAFGLLTDFECFERLRKRRELAAQQKAQPGGAPKIRDAEFRIKTQMLDAESQLREGNKRLEAGNYRGATEYFQYACDIEPSAKALASLAFANYRLNPTFSAPKTLEELTQIGKREPTCEEVWLFQGSIAADKGRFEEAENAFRQGCRIAPQSKTLAEALQRVRARKWVTVQ